MTGGQLANGLGSCLVTVASATFIVSYGLLAKFYKSQLGRFMILKAVGICLTGVITVALTVANFTANYDWLRYIQAVLWTIIAAGYINHTMFVWKSQLKGRYDDGQGT